MSKRSYRKRVITAAVLISTILVGVIVSIVAVLAAQNYRVKTNVSIAYLVSGVGAKVNSSYAIVPLDESISINRVAMTYGSNTDLYFGVSQEATSAQMTPEESLSLNVRNQEIVFEYYFQSTSDGPFSIELSSSPGKNKGDNIMTQTKNMVETYYVSTTRLTADEYRERTFTSTLAPQALTEYGQEVYIYVSAKVEDENRNAYYNGAFLWELTNQKAIDVYLNDGNVTKTLKVISNDTVEGINMPCVKIPTQEGSTFGGYYFNDSQYITIDGTGVHVADLSEGSTLSALWFEGMTIENLTLTSIEEASLDEDGALIIPEGVRVLGDGQNNLAMTVSPTSVVVPSSVEKISDGAFAGSSISNIEFVESSASTLSYADKVYGLKEIGFAALAGCTNLKTITLPSTLKKIGQYAFDWSVLESVTIPSSVEVMDSSFTSSQKLKTVIFEENSNVKSLTETFAGCSELSDINLPEGLEILGSSVFAGNSSLKRITMPTTLKKIERNAFVACTGLTAINLKDLKSWIKVDMGKDANNHPFIEQMSTADGYKDTELYVNDELITHLVIPAGVQKMEQPSFAFCGSIKSVEFCSDLKYLNYDAILSPAGLITSFYLDSVETWCKMDTDNTLPFTYTNEGGGRIYVDGELLTDLAIPEYMTDITEMFKFGFLPDVKTVRFHENISSFNWEAFIMTWNVENIYVENLETFFMLGEFKINLNKPYNLYLKGALATDVVVPNTIQYLPDYAFCHCKSIRSITISERVQSIGNYAFSSMSNLTRISIPSSVKTIESNALSAAMNLIQIRNLSGIDLWTKGLSSQLTPEIIENENQEFSSTIEENEKYAILTTEGSKTLLYAIDKEIIDANDIPDDITIINSCAFEDCKNLRSVTIPAGVVSIGGDAFLGCYSLVQVRNLSTNAIAIDQFLLNNLPEYAEVITSTAQYSGTFEDSGNYTIFSFNGKKILVNLLNKNISEINDIPNEELIIGKRAFYNCERLSRVTIPSNVVQIDEYAFSNCQNLQSISIGSGVQIINNNAFYFCRMLKEVTFESGSNLNIIGSRVFEYCINLKNITLPSNLKVLGEYAFLYCSSLTSIVIPHGVTELLDSVFSGCSGLTNVTIPSSVTRIEKNAFDSCTGLTDITIPESVKQIGMNVFYNCSSLERIVLPSGLLNLGDGVFQNCSKLTTVNIPEGITSIGGNLFYNCQSLESIDIPSGVTIIGNNAFRGCSRLSNITMPANLKTIGTYAFHSCSTLKNITIPASVTTIGTYAFYNCPYLTEINFNATTLNNLSSYNYTFYNAGKIGSGITVNIGANVTKIPAYLFNPNNTQSYSPKIKTVNFAEGSVCTTIASHAFGYNSNLTQINIPSSVTQIATYAFRYCTGLKTITIPSGVTSIGIYAFADCGYLTTINYNATSCSDLTSSSNVFYNTGRSGTGITINVGANVTRIPMYLFSLSSNTNSVYVPKIKTLKFAEGSVCSEIGLGAFGGNTILANITIPSSVTTIGYEAFKGCSGLTSITVNSGNTTYNSGNGSNCIIETASNKIILGCKNTTIPDDLTSIGSYAFMNITSLTRITIPTSVTNIGEYAFSGCSGLTSITIPENVTTIGARAFDNCSSLTEINYNVTGKVNYNETYDTSNVSSIFYSAGTNGTGITLNIGANVKVIPGAILMGVKTLKTINFAEGSVCEEIGGDAFNGCTGLTSVVIPASVKKMWPYAFAFCTNLTSVTFENTNGWSVKNNSSGTSGTIDVTISSTNLASNATLLKTTYRDYYWYCA